MKKRIAAALLAGITLMVSVTGCSGGGTEATRKAPETTPQGAAASEETKALSPVALEGVDLNNLSPVLKKINDRGTLIVGNDSTYPPFGFKDPQTNEAIGVEKEMATAIAAKLSQVLGKEIKLQFESMDFSAVLSSLASGTIDLVCSACTVTEERKQIMDFSDTYLNTKDCLLVLDEKKAGYSTLADFKDKALAANTGSSQEKRANDLSTSVVSLPTTSDAILQLKAGKVEAIVIDNIVAKRYIFNDPSLHAFEISDEELAPVDKAVAMQKGNEDLKAIVNAAIAEQKEAGNIDQWIDEYTEIAAEMQVGS
ncbi:substrate-binding periplasmic protein [Lacrimispora sp. JR3]|uniref:substrate-binding periplasmic protein n=1 Tax=Lacrimispora sinapis TaxID=3111456 RepID=UPI003749D1F5